MPVGRNSTTLATIFQPPPLHSVLFGDDANQSRWDNFMCDYEYDYDFTKVHETELLDYLLIYVFCF